jgi:hypothetical protein
MKKSRGFVVMAEICCSGTVGKCKILHKLTYCFSNSVTVVGRVDLRE